MQTATSPNDTARRKRALVSSAIIFVLTVAVIFGVMRLTAPTKPQTSADVPNQGVLLGDVAAPTFALTDQHGATVTLDSLKGRPTVFTFFDSVCPHTDCSLMAQYINVTARGLGGDADKVNWVALSLNPWHDTQQAVTTFISNQKLSPRLAYLTGSALQLQPLWDAFHMQVTEQADGIVIHTTGVYLLDSQARELVYMDEGFDPHALTADVRLALTQGASAFGGSQPTPQKALPVIEAHTVDGMQVTLTSAPGQYGAYDYTIVLQDLTGQTIPNARVSLDLSMADMKMQPVHVDMQPATPASTGAYHATGVLSMRGRWLADVTITRPGATQPSVTVFSFEASH